MERQASVGAHLVRLGFRDSGRVAGLLASPAMQGLVSFPDDDNGLLRVVSGTADPDTAVLALVRLLESVDRAEASEVRRDELWEMLSTAGPGRDRLAAVCGVSSALADHLVAHPQHWVRVAEALPLGAPERVRRLVRAVDPHHRGAHTAYDALRIAYREQLVAICAADVVAPDPRQMLPATAAALADLAAAALEAALVIAAQEHPREAAAARLAVIGMGKCGGRELNYISDVDVVFVVEPAGSASEVEAVAAATILASAVMRACAVPTAEGSLWQVDAALRPEGKQGPLVRTVASHLAYYRRWAKTWEFQALVKARCVAGDQEVGRSYLEAVRPLVWQAAGRDRFVEDVQAMRRRVEAHVPAAEASRQVKLGPGGLRDIEFSVQLLQLVHGRTHESLRSGSTLEALAALSEGGYVAREDAARLDAAYRFLRSMEHRIQLHRMRRTHLMPTASADLRRLGRSMNLRSQPAEQVVAAWHDEAREVRRLHEKLFYRPLLAAAARLTTDEVRLTPQAAQERLKVLGFRDQAGAMRHLEALTRGFDRTAAIHRQLLPVMLGWFADEADPDAGLLAYRKVSEALGRTPWYMRMLRDSAEAAEQVAHVLARSRFAGDLLVRIPDAVRLFGESEGMTPRTRDQLVATMRSAITRKDGPDEAVEAARMIRRAELFRVAVADLTGAVSAEQVGEALTDLAEALLECALYVATKRVGLERGTPVPADIAVIGMGRFGGREMSYASDADVLFVHRPHPGADEQVAASAASAVVVELRRVLGLAGPDPQLDLDADLRPEGKAGPVVRTVEGYRGYYERWAQTWEFHALLRARLVAGDPQVGAQFIEMADRWRYPDAGVTVVQERDIRRLKARMESERLPRGADPRGHVKLGPGGLSDVEWTVQLLQLRHASEHPGLRATGTLPALEAAVAAEVLSAHDAAVLREAWVASSRVRDAAMLWRGRATDSLPSDVRDAEGIARIMGLSAGQGFTLTDDVQRSMRRARMVTERLFYGRDEAS
ncbi:Bifunctional glutamine synthetase adenylyltransferase/adenylyl-removing enzyme [Austwickia sp. TVS 96-490-7B]|uniref:bifunctional [glutamine synthetase] adenylyltransferase/[glutamine synthetase]-adenylyl-L-tyrosine phosphorylase n=1 Tax=Austwickia sp. TVS 96-490-7B TaxID=2830843 RepID=UPI001C591C1A|nr:bifunctional [glutamine synthetase] adenylyltransferase/[glutamine synthetase]-adenylyl-L-tyrosine phosphorylase [Austwickia sp. TVS 96-490-7B]MBW3086419.1 Bifunctional glutamine synthetase adenylyltransferase/adenylyl-removing enzyme [Austwickia sp. TVS 96-490-7B]